jgi:hypothetical protein
MNREFNILIENAAQYFFILSEYWLEMIKCNRFNFLGINYLIFPVAPGPGVYSASNRNEYQRH